METFVSDAGNAVRNGNPSKTAATIECIEPNAGYAFGDGNASKTATSLEHIVINGGNAVANYHSL